VFDHPVTFALVVFALSIAAYIPMSDAFGPSAWKGVGPFQVQISCVFLYLLYFLAGTWLGARGIDRSAVLPRARLPGIGGRGSLRARHPTPG